MTTTIEIPSLTLSHEEVVLLLRLLGAPTMPGIGENPLTGLTPEQSQLVLSSAERSLKARQIITVNADNSINVERFALALVGPCVMPELSVIATCNLKSRPPEPLYFHLAQRMVVEHAITGPGLHTFAALLNRQVLLERLVSFLYLQSQIQLTTSTGTISVKLLGQAVELAGEGNIDTTTILREGGLSDELSSILSKDLANLLANLGVVVINHQLEGNDHIKGISLLASTRTIWQLNNVSEPGESIISIQSVSATEIKTQLEKWIMINDI